MKILAFDVGMPTESKPYSPQPYALVSLIVFFTIGPQDVKDR
jgi:hypothetical protein